MPDPGHDCPPWCDGAHDVLYEICGDSSERNHFREIGRLNEEGHTQVVVGIALTTTPGGEPLDPCVELIHLDKTGRPVEELADGDVYLTPGEAEALAPLLVRAAELLRGVRLVP